MQKYGKFPAVLKVRLKVDPEDRIPEFQRPSGLHELPEVVEWPPLPQFHLTVSPTWIDIVLGAKLNPPPGATLTMTVVPEGGVGVRVGVGVAVAEGGVGVAVATGVKV